MTIQDLLKQSDFEVDLDNYGIRYRARIIDVGGDEVEIKRADGMIANSVIHADPYIAHRVLVEALHGATLDKTVTVPAALKSDQEEALATIYAMRPDVDKGEQDLMLSDLYNPTSLLSTHYAKYRKDPSKTNKKTLKDFVHRGYDRDETYKNDGKKAPSNTVAPGKTPVDPATAQVNAKTQAPSLTPMPKDSGTDVLTPDGP